MWGGCIMFGGPPCPPGLLGLWFGGCVSISNMDGIFFILSWTAGSTSKCLGGDPEKSEIFAYFANLNDLFYNSLWISSVSKKYYMCYSWINNGFELLFVRLSNDLNQF